MGVFTIATKTKAPKVMRVRVVSFSGRDCGVERDGHIGGDGDGGGDEVMMVMMVMVMMIMMVMMIGMIIGTNRRSDDT